MSRKLTMFVHAVERDEHGNTTRSQVFGPDDTVPSWARKAITNPDVWDGEDDGDSEDISDEPPRSGRGSGADAWTAYAQAQGINVPADATRDDVIALVDDHKSRG